MVASLRDSSATGSRCLGDGEGDDDSSQDELRAMQSDWKRQRVGGNLNPWPVDASTRPSEQAELAQLITPSHEAPTIAEVDWLRFMLPEIKQAQAAFADRPMLINTMCSGIGAATEVLKESTA
jgi:hypothetical protein